MAHERAHGKLQIHRVNAIGWRRHSHKRCRWHSQNLTYYVGVMVMDVWLQLLKLTTTQFSCGYRPIQTLH